MIRHLADLAVAGQVWGVDFNEKHIYWCQQHLTPPFRSDEHGQRADAIANQIAVL